MSGCARVWGVLNVTPDSFSDGGLHLDARAAVEAGLRMCREGAAVIDVGGESSRPPGAVYGEGAPQVPEEEELRRVVPVVRSLTLEHGVAVSIDTVKAEVARAAIDAGARIVNDVSCGASEALLDVVGASGVELVLMHTRGRGEVNEATTRYADVVGEVLEELRVAVERAERHGVGRARIWIDPGLGFAKTPAQSMALIAATARFVETGLRVLVGASRKGFLAAASREAGLGDPAPSERLGGSIATALAAELGGAHAVRVHDVKEVAQALAVFERVRAPGGDGLHDGARP